MPLSPSEVERVGLLASDYLRRPDMSISEFNRVRLRIANLCHAGLTEAELRLAAQTNVVIDEHERCEHVFSARRRWIPVAVRSEQERAL